MECEGVLEERGEAGGRGRCGGRDEEEAPEALVCICIKHETQLILLTFQDTPVMLDTCRSLEDSSAIIKRGPSCQLGLPLSRAMRATSPLVSRPVRTEKDSNKDTHARHCLIAFDPLCNEFHRAPNLSIHHDLCCQTGRRARSSSALL